jgi:hypothetical protein
VSDDNSKVWIIALLAGILLLLFIAMFFKGTSNNPSPTPVYNVYPVQPAVQPTVPPKS